MRITGTFLDEISHDIPSQNWGLREWQKDFDEMKSVGIDTVILIRAGYKERACFDSKVLNQRSSMVPAYTDLVQLFLDQAQRCSMQFYFGLYDSGRFWHENHYEKEADLNLEFCHEVIDKYGNHPAFAGWYISHEIHGYNPPLLDTYLTLAEGLKKMKSLPILISPYIKGVKQFGGHANSLEDHREQWERVFKTIQGHIDIIAFQDGHVELNVLSDYLKLHQELAAKHGITCWSNIETFDRDIAWNFPPIDFRKLKYKMDASLSAGVEKLITFEFSHFLSPNSMYPTAHNLYQKYKAWHEGQ